MRWDGNNNINRLQSLNCEYKRHYKKKTEIQCMILIIVRKSSWCESIVVNWLHSSYFFVCSLCDIACLLQLHSLDAFPEEQTAPMDTQDEERPLIHPLPTQVTHLPEPYRLISCPSVNNNRDYLLGCANIVFIGTLTNLDKASRC